MMGGGRISTGPAAAAVLAVLFFCTAASATVVRVLSLPELVSGSEVISLVTVESSSSRWEDGRIVTRSVARVDLPLAGADSGARIEVLTLGGEVGDVGQRVFGEPVLRSGERYLVFLAPAGDGRSLRCVGMAQGALPVVAGPAGDEVVPNADLPRLIEPGAEMSIQPWLGGPRPLGEVVDEVRSAAARSGR